MDDWAWGTPVPDPLWKVDTCLMEGLALDSLVSFSTETQLFCFFLSSEILWKSLICDSSLSSGKRTELWSGGRQAVVGGRKGGRLWGPRGGFGAQRQCRQGGAPTTQQSLFPVQMVQTRTEIGKVLPTAIQAKEAE